MKWFFVVVIIVVSQSIKAQDPYALSFPSIDGQTINLSDYNGKKLLVVTMNAAAPDTAQLRRVDSFYLANSAILSVIALPVDDFGTPLPDSTLSTLLKDNLSLHYIIGQIGKAAKMNNNEQQVFLGWLTHVSDNNHFDEDITQDGQMYMLNEKGLLFGSFDKATPISFLDSAVKQNSND